MMSTKPGALPSELRQVDSILEALDYLCVWRDD